MAQPNPFDRFDPPPATAANPFDRFDPPRGARPGYRLEPVDYDPWSEFTPAPRAGSMPTFEVTDGSGRYHVTAPNEEVALREFQRMKTGQPPAPSKPYRLEPVDHDPFAPPASPTGPQRVTDPDLIAQLEGAPAPTMRRVTDPDILRQLNGEGPLGPAVRAEMPPAVVDEDGGFPIIPPGGRVPVMPVAPTNPSGQPLPVAAQGGAANAFWRGSGQGVSLGSADELAGLTAAATGGNMNSAIDESRRANEAARAAHPWAYGAGSLVGGAVGLAPAMIAAPAAFGLKAGTALLPRMAASGLSGLGIGAMQGVMEGQGGISDRAPNAVPSGLMGGSFGLAGPAIGAGLGAIARGATSYFSPTVSGLGRGGSAAALDAFEAAGPSVVQQRAAELGPGAMLLDTAQPFLGRAQGLAAMPGEAGERVVSALRARDSGTNARLATEVEGAFGPAPRPSQISAGIDAGQAALGPEYQRALAGASRVDTSALAERLEAGIVNARGDAQRAMRQVRADLDIPGNPGNLDPNPQALLATRQAIDGRLRTEADPNTIRVLTTARQEIDAELTRAVPGIKDVDAQFAELARQRDALTRGGQVMDAGKTALRPADLADEIAVGALPQGTMVGPSAAPLRLREGVRADVDRVLGNNTNDLAALRSYVRGDGDWSRAKLAQVFGPDEADRVIRAVDRETAFRDAFVKVVEGSQSAQRLAGAKSVGVREVAPTAADPNLAIAGAAGGPQGVAGAIGLGLLRRGVNLVGRQGDLNRNRMLADMLTRTGAERDATIVSLADAVASRRARAAAAGQIDPLVAALLSTEGRQEPVSEQGRLIGRMLMQATR